MPNTLRIKRRGSGSAGAPSSLENAELAFNEVDNTLYYGEGTGGAGGSASTVLAIGGDGAFVNKTGTQTISGDKTFTGSFDLSGATVAGFTVAQNLIVSGNLTVNGTQTVVNSTTVSVDDKNLELGATSSPTDAGANGGGITLKATTDKTFNWIDATDSWTSSEHLELAAAKNFRINGVAVLSQTGLGSTVVNSVLTSTGTITTGVWAATDIAILHGGTGASTATQARQNLGLAIGSDIQQYDIELAALAAVTSAANKLPYFTGSGSANVTDFTAYARSLMDDANAATARSTLGLGSIATQNFNAVNIDGGTIDGITFDMGTF